MSCLNSSLLRYSDTLFSALFKTNFTDSFQMSNSWSSSENQVITPPSLLALPTEIKIMVLKNLPTPDLGRVCFACKALGCIAVPLMLLTAYYFRFEEAAQLHQDGRFCIFKAEYNSTCPLQGPMLKFTRSVPQNPSRAFPLYHAISLFYTHYQD